MTKPTTIKSICILLMLMGSNYVFSQKNLVPNPSFEEYHKLPSQEADFHLVKEWKSPSSLDGNKASYPKATVDYLHLRGSGAAKAPNTYYGKITPYDGEGVAHFGVTNGSSDFREYLAVRLKSAPEVGKRYNVSFYLANAEENSYGNRASKDVHVLFTNDFPRQSQAEALSSYTPQLKMEEMFYSKTWKRISFTYIPTEANLDVMVIGNFYPPSKTELGAKYEGRYNDAYFFIDLVSVEPMESSSTPPVVVSPKMVTLVVTALDKKTLKPINSVRLALAAAEADESVLLTNGEGKAEFKIPFADYYSITGTAPNYKNANSDLSLVETKTKIEHTIYLERNPPRGTSVVVRVIDQESKSALEKSIVELIPNSTSERVRSIPTLNGYSRFSLPLWTEFDVKITKDGYLPFAQNVKAIEGPNPDSLYVELIGALKKKEIKVLVKGKLMDHVTKNPLSGEVQINFAGKTETLTATSGTGFQFTLPYQAKISYQAKAKGYLQLDGERDINPSTSDIELTLNIELEKLEIGKTVRLKNVLFVQGQPTLLPESYPELDKLLSLLKDNPDVKIEMAGHTDNIGNPQKNQQLSEARVAKIKEYLVGKGIVESRITGKGYGGSKPLYDGPNPNLRAQNRRVEFTIVE